MKSKTNENWRESLKQIKHNRSLWKYYPIGMVQAAGDLLNGIRGYLDPTELKALEKVEDALYTFDELVRERRHKKK